MGFQTMAGYEYLRSKYGMFTYKDVSSFFKPEDEVDFIEKKTGHDELNPFCLSKIEKSKHMVLLDKNSKLANIFKKTYLNMPSVHSWCVKDDVFVKNTIYKVVGRSEDDNIEAIESVTSNWWAIGVQFHPELEEDNLDLFKSLVNEAKRR